MSEAIIKSKLFRVLRAVLNIGLLFGMIVTAVCLIMLIIYPLLSGENTLFSSFGLSFDGMMLSGGMIAASGMTYLLFCFSTFFTFLTGLVCIFLLRNIVNSMWYGSPFTMQNVRRIRLIGFTLFIWTYLHQISVYLFVKELVSSDSALGEVIKARFTFFPETAVIALCVIVLAEVFHYGCTLQKEHDTTV